MTVTRAWLQRLILQKTDTAQLTPVIGMTCELSDLSVFTNNHKMVLKSVSEYIRAASCLA